MALQPIAISPTALTTGGVFSLFSVSNLKAMFDLYQLIRQRLPGNTDMYEILDYESTLELCDTKGATAIFQKRQRVKFLQNNIIAFEDYVWGDGDVLADYKCSPGVVADRYQEGDRWNILISLRETKNKGDITEFHIERLEKDTFLKADEWQQTEIRRKTRRLQMNIIFPKRRRCQRAVLMQRRHNRIQVLGPEHFHELPDGRQLLTWESKRIFPYDIFTIKWHW
ncbi:MAG: hypothetical protein KDE53_40785 [Caldilineaceae bacterium]|nr:hypothetical protein [Caldilineaceae bacterium]